MSSGPVFPGPKSAGPAPGDYGGARKVDVVRAQLDSKNVKDKMDAMRRLIEMMTKGRDVSNFFPDVVKNVITPVLELKKMVYLFLVQYAEANQEAALMTINSFQKDMADKNQVIRALALRVMASIRVLDIVQVTVLAIRKCAQDSSPYVRKAAAHAVPKLYSLDSSQLDTMVEIIGGLLKDSNTMVLGSALAAFQEVCPDRWDLIHPHFRKLCHLVVDTSEWGQIMIINMLNRYGRAHFTNPTAAETEADLKDAAFYSDEEQQPARAAASKRTVEIDPDHRLLLKSVQPLLQSRNSGVVMAVASLYFYLAPLWEAVRAAKPIVRIARSPPEIQYAVLANIATMAAARPAMFAPFTKEFFIRSTDPQYVRALKLEVLTILASDTNVSLILREFKTHLRSNEEATVVATIQAVGRVAARQPDMADACLKMLVAELQSRSPNAVAEAVVEIKKLVQMHPDGREPVLISLARLVDTIKIPAARSSIVWVIGEFASRIPGVAPDVLRKLAKTFVDEDDTVRLQTLNLAAKLFVQNPAQCTALFHYVCNMARYDTNFDIRDRARLVRRVFNLDGTGAASLEGMARELFFAEKPMPVVTLPSAERARFAVGSLSHLVAHRASHYVELPEFPETPSDPSLRAPPVEREWTAVGGGATAAAAAAAAPAARERGFYDSTSEGSAGSRSSSRSRSGSYSGSGSFYSSASGSRSRSYSGSESGSGSYTGTDSEGSAPPSPRPQRAAAAPSKSGGLEELLAALPETSPAPGAGRSAAVDSLTGMFDGVVAAEDRPRVPLLNAVTGAGLGAEASFTREPSMYGQQYHVVRLYLHNAADIEIGPVALGRVTVDSSQDVKPFDPVAVLAPHSGEQRLLHINFGGSTSQLRMELTTDRGAFGVRLACPVGELMRPLDMSQADFDKRFAKMGGMQETAVSFRLSGDVSALLGKVLTAVNCAPIATDADEGVLKVAASAPAGDAVLIRLKLEEGAVRAVVRTDAVVLGPQLAEAIKKL